MNTIFLPLLPLSKGLYGTSLVSTHVVYEGLCVMQRQARLREFLVKNSLSALTQVFEECVPTQSPEKKIVRDVGTLDLSWSRVSLPHENLAKLRDFGFELVQSTPPPTPPHKSENMARLRDFGFELACVWRLTSISPKDRVYRLV